MKSFLRSLSVLGCLCAGAALANPRPLGFSYTTDTSPAGESEIEQYIDATPIRAMDFTGADVWQPRFTLNTEFEHGITDQLELGLYVQLSNAPGEVPGMAPLSFDGMKQRLRYRLNDAGEWPVDVALYLELAELKNEFEVEGKVILQRRIGRARLVANLWAERELYYNGNREWVINPTAGVTWQLTPAVHVGAEYWMRAEFPDISPAAGANTFNLDAHHFVGPNVLWQLGKLWWLTGAYGRVDGMSRDAQQGDLYGRFFVRTVLGLEL